MPRQPPQGQNKEHAWKGGEGGGEARAHEPSSLGNVSTSSGVWFVQYATGHRRQRQTRFVERHTEQRCCMHGSFLDTSGQQVLQKNNGHFGRGHLYAILPLGSFMLVVNASRQSRHLCLWCLHWSHCQNPVGTSSKPEQGQTG